MGIPIHGFRWTGIMFAILTTGCGGHSSSGSNHLSGQTVYGKPGQTVKELIDSLPQDGGIVILGTGTWASGFDSGGFISKPNVTIQGAGMPAFNSDFSAMAGGTIVLGTLAASTGADFITVRDLGVDVGSAYINARDNGMARDGFAIYNYGQVLGARPVESPLIENVSCLGYSLSAAVHCMLVENVNNAYVHNVQAVMNCHGVVLKGRNSKIDGVLSRGHSVDALIVKSDAYAPASKDTLSNINVQPLFSPGDTKGIIIIAAGASVSDIHISNVQVNSPAAWGIYVQGVSKAATATGVTLSGISVDYPGGSPPDQYCMQFVQYVSGVQVRDLNCTNMWTGIGPYLPDPVFFNDFIVTGSQFTTITTNAIQTYGSWGVFDNSFRSIGGNGIVNPFGVTVVASNTFANVAGSNTLSTGGSFVSPPTSRCLSPVKTACGLP